MSENQKTIACDECGYEFPLESVNIQEQSVKCENEQLSLMFFTCPKCNKIYRVLLKDARYVINYWRSTTGRSPL